MNLWRDIQANEILSYPILTSTVVVAARKESLFDRLRHLEPVKTRSASCASKEARRKAKNDEAKTFSSSF